MFLLIVRLSLSFYDCDDYTSFITMASITFVLLLLFLWHSF